MAEKATAAATATMLQCFKGTTVHLEIRTDGNRAEETAASSQQASRLRPACPQQASAAADCMCLFMQLAWPRCLGRRDGADGHDGATEEYLNASSMTL